jgi:hypothetical protein
MTPADHVTAIHILCERNPRVQVATFQLGPAIGARGDLDPHPPCRHAERDRRRGAFGRSLSHRRLAGARHRAACLDETAG